MDLIHPLAESYAESITTPENDLLKQINDETTNGHAHPHMLSGHVQGRFLSMISAMIQPKYILEIGTFTGYSALCLAEGLQPGGELHTIEIREEDVVLSRSNFSKSTTLQPIHLHHGTAKEIIPGLNHPWDLVFIDADKPSYIDYYELVVPQMRKGGIILADNVFFHGDVLQDPVTSKNGKAIDAFNHHVKNDPRTEQVLVSIRDGVLMIKKK